MADVKIGLSIALTRRFSRSGFARKTRLCYLQLK